MILNGNVITDVVREKDVKRFFMSILTSVGSVSRLVISIQRVDIDRTDLCPPDGAIVLVLNDLGWHKIGR